MIPLETVMQRVKFEPRCKVCKLSKSNPDLFLKIHKLYFHDRKSLVQIAKTVNPTIKAQKLGRPLVEQNLTAHLRGIGGRPPHIPVHADVTARIQQAVRTPLVVTNETNATEAHYKAQQEGVIDQLNLYREGVDLYRELDGMLSLMREQLTDSDGQLRIDRRSLTAYLSIIRELRSVLGELSKIQSVEKLVMAVASVCVESLTFDYLNALSPRLSRVGLPEEQLSAVRHAVGTTLAEHSKAAIRRVKEGDLVLN